MADWEEIKRLAADFQRAQLSSTIQRLSERNCVEIVQRLLDLQLIEVIYTVDGKEYLTPQELAKEIREELTVRGGRVNVVDLAQVLNVDLTHVETKVNEVVRTDKNLTLVLGQLIDETYVEALCEEINDLLQDQGQVTIADLTKTYDLPAEFLSESIKSRLGTVIKGQIDTTDRNIIFTEAFVNRHKAKIRGCFSALTRPTPVANVVAQCGLQERIFHSIMEELLSQGRLAGSINSGRLEKALYVPEIYTRSQNNWVDSFYKQNGYLEYDALTRLGLSDAKGYIRKRFKSEPLTYLSTCCVGKAIIERITAEIEEALFTATWVDILPSMPSICSMTDVSQVAQQCLKSLPEGRLFCDTIVISQKMLTECSESFDKLMAEKADRDAKNNMAVLSASSKVAGLTDGGAARDDKRDQRRKKASGGKAGGGLQGRESKTKSVKKKGHKGAHERDGSDDEMAPPSGKNKEIEFEFLSPDEIQQHISKQSSLQDCPEELLTEMASTLYRPLKKQYQPIARSVFQQNLGSDSGSSRKKTHGELSEKISGMWTNAKLFEKGAKQFPEELQNQLNRHLLRTICTDMTNLVFNAVATEQLMSVSENTEITQEMRLKMLNKLADDKTRAILTKLHTSLNEKTLDEFFQQLELICGTGQLEIVLKKPDKKKERQLVFSHRQSLAAQLRQEESPAMALHLATVLILQVHTATMVHAPGRCVPQLIAALKPYLKEEEFEVLHTCQELVIEQLKATADLEEGEIYEDDGLEARLNELVPKVKEVALSTRKANNNNQQEAE